MGASELSEREQVWTPEPLRVAWVRTQVGCCYKIVPAEPVPGQHERHADTLACLYLDGHYRESFDNPTGRAAVRLVECVNACAGLDPAGVPGLVEAVEGELFRAGYDRENAAAFPSWVLRLAAALAKVKGGKDAD